MLEAMKNPPGEHSPGGSCSRVGVRENNVWVFGLQYQYTVKGPQLSSAGIHVFASFVWVFLRICCFSVGLPVHSARSNLLVVPRALIRLSMAVLRVLRRRSCSVPVPGILRFRNRAACT